MAGETPNRIRMLRRARGMSGQELAQRAGTSVQQIYRLEVGARRLTVEWMKRLADALGCAEYELWADSKGSSPRAPIVGCLRSVEVIDRLPHAEEVAAPHPGYAAIRVDSDALLPRYGEGDLLFFDAAKRAISQECYGSECVLEDSAGNLTLEVVLGPAESGAHRVARHGSYRGHDVAVTWASRVDWVRRATVAPQNTPL